ncbi:hypothetical protein [Nocardia asiatica]|uniref:hypothetical protein n=1 Tax=Nocardia asiatica TaxID=209252 RepID=UPI0024584DED|nr:hypothetical protein [Nocardia asiatica]
MVARLLGVSRSTIYKYVLELGKQLAAGETTLDVAKYDERVCPASAMLRAKRANFVYRTTTTVTISIHIGATSAPLAQIVLARLHYQ